MRRASYALPRRSSSTRGLLSGYRKWGGPPVRNRPAGRLAQAVMIQSSNMASYLFEVAYTPAALAALVADPQDRVKVVGAVIKKLGGKLTGFWFSFGDSDIIGIIEMPDNVSMAALSMAI